MNTQKNKSQKFSLVIHGGAGDMPQTQLTEKQKKAYADRKETMAKALKAGYEILAAGGSSLDAVQVVVIIMEDDPLFNAGKGSVFTNDECNELDAAIMDGKTLNAGAVAGVDLGRDFVRRAADVRDPVGARGPHAELGQSPALRRCLRSQNHRRSHRGIFCRLEIILSIIIYLFCSIF